MNSRTIILAGLFLFSAFASAIAAPADSLRLEKKEGKTFLIHQVEPKETLYSIARKYTVPPGEVVKANPEAAKSMKVGDLVKVPYTKTAPAASATTPKQTTGSTTTAKEPVKNTEPVTAKPSADDLDDEAVIEHTVKSGETLYKIADKYGVKVADISKWNNMKAETGVKVGQKLKIRALTEIEEKPEPVKKVEEKPKEQEKPQKEKFSTKVTDTQSPVGTSSPQPGIDTVVASKVSYKEGAVEKVKVSGIAEVIDNKDLQEKYLAYSNDLPLGTMIKVKNIATEEFVFLKVVGKVKSVKPNVILEIGAKAKERLDSKFNSFKVEVTYVK